MTMTTEAIIPNRPDLYVYIHRRPNGEVFYVGKGTGRRAWDFSPTRRTLHHRNVTAKHGRENIIIDIIPAMYEAEAMMLERAHILLARQRGDRLVNLTDGGEGVSGRAVSEAQAAALAKGRGKGRKLSEDAKRRIDDGLAIGRVKSAEWLKSDDGQAHLAALGKAGASRLHAERAAVCVECGGEFTTKSAKARCCSRLCEQRNRRARQKHGGYSTT